MAWLVSMKWRANFWHLGRVTTVGDTEGLVLLDEHPSKYVADCKRRLNALHEAKEQPECGKDRADDIRAIYSVIEVPDGMLTEDEIDLLS